MHPDLYNNLPVHLITNATAIRTMFHPNLTFHNGCICSLRTHILQMLSFWAFMTNSRNKSWEISSLMWQWHHLVLQNNTAVQMLHGLWDRSNLGGYAVTKGQYVWLSTAGIVLHGHASMALRAAQSAKTEEKTTGCKIEPPFWMMHETMALDPQWCGQWLLCWAYNVIWTAVISVLCRKQALQVFYAHRRSTGNELNTTLCSDGVHNYHQLWQWC